MLKACSYCGRIHEGECPNKPKRDYKREHDNANSQRVKIRRFRSSQLWQRCRREVLDRDKHLCVLCFKDEGIVSVNEQLDVHHIEPLHSAWAKRLCKKNLITLCKRHHAMADRGEIRKNYLKKKLQPPLSNFRKFLQYRKTVLLPSIYTIFPFGTGVCACARNIYLYI